MNIRTIMRGIARSKTMIASTVLAIGGVVEAQMQFFATLIGPEFFGWFSVGVGVLMAILRVTTNKSLSAKGE